MWEAANNGETCIDPLFFHYPTYEETYKEIENEFIFANSIKVTPITISKATSVHSFFPKGSWVSVLNPASI